MNEITLNNDEIGALHVPAKGNRLGGLVMIHEIFGVTENIREICAGYAEDGYEVIVPYLFDRLEKNFQGSEENIEKAVAIAEKTKLDGTVADMQAAIDRLKPPVFIMGYCYGGSATWVASCRCRGLTAAVGYYGRLIIDYVQEKPKIPIILHFGEHDDTIPMENVRQIEADHPDIDIYIYPAGHGFNSNRPTHHHAESAALARERTLAHFRSFT